jgi:hypothetical protein
MRFCFIVVFLPFLFVREIGTAVILAKATVFLEQSGELPFYQQRCVSALY